MCFFVFFVVFVVFVMIFVFVGCVGVLFGGEFILEDLLLSEYLFVVWGGDLLLEE